MNHHQSPSPINQLPDETLIHILSFLPLKEAAATSAVSIRWRYLWASRDRLDFDFNFHAEPRFEICRTTGNLLETSSKSDVLAERTPRYIRWVNHVMALRQDLALDEFSISLALNHADHGDVIDFWLMSALSSGVKRLKFDFSLHSDERRRSEGFYNFPADKLLVREGCCSLIKSLCLKCVNVDEEALERLIVSACPALESIVLQNVGCLEKLKLCLPSSRLENLELCDCFLLQSVQIIDAPSLVSFNCDCSQLQIVQVIDAPSLVSFKCEHVVNNCLLRKLPKLVELSVAMVDINPLTMWKPYSSILSQLKRLKIDGEMPLTYAHIGAGSKLSKLEELEITVYECRNISLMPYTVLVEQAPYLKKLIVRVLYPGSYTNRDYIAQKPREPPCCFKHLKVLEFYGYHGRAGDNSFIWYLVENAASLETIVIDPSYQPSDRQGLSSRTWRGYQEGQLLAAKVFGSGLPLQVKLVIA
ncbi:FBD-associated F-box protein At4g10400 [Linum perenne]